MSYTPINWQTGDTITAEKMNKMDNGWSYSSGSSQLLFSESVTTENDGDFNVGQLSYSDIIPDGNLLVTFDGVDYECTCTDATFGSDSESFEDYPFYVFFSGMWQSNGIETATEGTHTISVSIGGSATIETSAEFRSAVNSCIDGQSPFLCVDGVTTYDEMDAARQSGRLMYFYVYGICHFVSSFVNDTSPTAVTAVPAGVANVETFGFEEDGDGNLIFNVFQY